MSRRCHGDVTAMSRRRRSRRARGCPLRRHARWYTRFAACVCRCVIRVGRLPVRGLMGHPSRPVGPLAWVDGSPESGQQPPCVRPSRAPAGQLSRRAACLASAPPALAGAYQRRHPPSEIQSPPRRPHRRCSRGRGIHRSAVASSHVPRRPARRRVTAQAQIRGPGRAPDFGLARRRL